MSKNLTCIECPKSCNLIVDIENCRVVKVSDNQCKLGESYAIAEIENPTRVLTSAVLARGLSLKMIPLRTDRPIEKAKLLEAMAEIKKIIVEKPVKAGDVILSNFLGLEVNLIATRECL
ncbi:MAG: hypothetical protein A3J51_03530 [Omnitrophica WOR_2 bacterium RIFCSPHIGHO2_02_FULL_45_21]|nr:MAG: hypothetical protein A3J51_03530 [Omnitrophica WOR_2 bacterium RIFCSPHIGHO2_02_FULL_45_21]